MKPPIPVVHGLRDDGSSPIPPREALEEIRRVWLDWAKQEIDETDFAARVAEVLEEAGYAVFKGDGG